MNENEFSQNSSQPEQRIQGDGSHRDTNETDATEDFALWSRVPTLQEAVHLSLTEKITDKTLFTFARAIRAFEMTTNMRIKQAEVPAVFAEWWRTAAAEKLLPADASYDEYLLVFEDTFPRTKVPLGANALTAALKRAKNAPLPEVAKQFSDPKIQYLVGVCFQLQQLAGCSPFFLSVRDCAKICGIKRLETACAILNGLVHRGILHIVKKGLPGKKGPATRYSFAGAKIETPGLVASENVPKLEEASTPLPTKIDKPSPSPN